MLVSSFTPIASLRRSETRMHLRTTEINLNRMESGVDHSMLLGGWFDKLLWVFTDSRENN